ADAHADLGVLSGIAHHAALPYPLPADLKLGLDEGDQTGTRRGECEGRRQDDLEADEAGVTDDEVDGLRNLGSSKVAGVGAFENDDPRVLAQLPGELAVADVDGIDAHRAARQQDVGEAAGRSPDVEADEAGGIDGETVQAMDELQAATGNPGV